MNAQICPEPGSRHQDPLPLLANRPTSPAADAALEFGHCRVLLRRRQLLADEVPVELGTRAFDLLLVLLEADGVLVSKEELLGRVWPGIVVSEENLKVQVCALRKALGADRDVIRTEFGRGYRFIGALRSHPAAGAVAASCEEGGAGTGLSLPRTVDHGALYRPVPARVAPRSQAYEH